MKNLIAKQGDSSVVHTDFLRMTMRQIMIDLTLGNILYLVSMIIAKDLSSFRFGLNYIRCENVLQLLLLEMH